MWKLKAETRERSSQLAQHIFNACAARDLHLALVELPVKWFGPVDGEATGVAAGSVTCLRSVLMKPEHEAWLDRIWDRLTAACVDVLGV